jgi:hypothetical protein
MLTRFSSPLKKNRGTLILDELYEVLPELTNFDDQQAASCAMVTSALADYWESVRDSVAEGDRKFLSRELRELYDEMIDRNSAMACGVYIISAYIECADLNDEHGNLVYNLAKLYIRRSKSILSGD